MEISKNRRLNSHEAAIYLLWTVRYPHIDLSFDDDAVKLPWKGTGRRFKTDFAEPGSRVCIEVQGGTRNGSGKHGRHGGIITDMTKLALANANGWLLFQVSSDLEEAATLFPYIAYTIVERWNQRDSMSPTFESYGDHGDE